MRIPNLEQLSVSRESVEQLVLLLLQPDSVWTRNALAERLGVSSMTVGKIVRVLWDGGLIESARVASVRGRQPEGFRWTSQGEYWILRVAQGGFSILLIEERGERVHRYEVAHEPSLSPEGNLEALLGRVQQMFHARAGSAGARCVGVLADGMDIGELQSVLGRIADAVENETVLLGRELLHPTYGEAVLYLRLDEQIVPSWRVGTQFLTPHFLPLDAGLPRTEQYDRIAQAVASMGHLMIPDRIVAEGFGRYERDSQVLLDRIGACWDRRNAPPVLSAPTGLCLAELGMLELLREKLAEAVSALIGT